MIWIRGGIFVVEVSDVAKQSKAPRKGVRMKHDIIYTSYIIIYPMTGSHFSRVCLNSRNVTRRLLVSVPYNAC